MSVKLASSEVTLTARPWVSGMRISRECKIISASAEDYGPVLAALKDEGKALGANYVTGVEIWVNTADVEHWEASGKAVFLERMW